ncbi:GNAT family N-acetyltransferase [Pseudobacteriovorax antillogorgiicola]|uniref:Protein N-acetyltransferase, RimJ/RimL family n=2 Tax=Pseudobacteriovorax antillogorgiicola TaxID=1513793 RepID=A0A1Y6BK92_9BACT|nr:GNAT family N-acetyltransferase [Pseudobacteriovorax antillogorgiicola]TCS55453.1 RimJ/RimL family protein N-acetyltransferase [Pseudobacteriovorax antillogorgiicola]SMF12298.1 Protein N-acetyltransferase, RimJ/RimL family [Pseudobacteriovorax antillogorgiicola]
MDHTPNLESERLVLRPPVMADGPSYQRHFADYEVIRHLYARVPWPYPEGGATEWLKNEIIPKQGQGVWSWAICEKIAPDIMIGGIELKRVASPTNRGFWLGRSYWGRGYMTEAVNLVTQFGFESLGFERMIFDNAVGNDRSARIKVRQGCRKIRTEKAQLVDPSYSEIEIWELTKDDWLANQKEQGI